MVSVWPASQRIEVAISKLRICPDLNLEMKETCFSSFAAIQVGFRFFWSKRIVSALLLWSFCQDVALFAAVKTDESAISFNTHIQPILSEYCYHCHGPDSATRKPKKNPLRLDGAKFAFELRDGEKPVIVKGDPTGSALMQRILTKDEDEVMPPTSEHKKLKPEQIALLEKWITQGARYEQHWAFNSPVRPAIPSDDSGWAKSKLDHFVVAKLKHNGLSPNPEQSKSRLFRRLSFDLTGLPPTPAELKSYMENRSPDAYEKAVDRMLQTDSSAEHFSRLWLDAVRYADTQGIHHDHARTIWPYRDWVIAAIKANKPFDQFTIEQIAGDLLPVPKADQLVASGYNRLLPTTGEGGAIEEEYKAIYAKDRVDTTAAVWLGLTTGCASCHDHKFDPISTKEFYSLTAFFRNSTVKTLDSGSHANTPPELFLPKKADWERWTFLQQEMPAHKRAMEEHKNEARPDFDRWLSDARNKPLEVQDKIKPLLLLPLTEAGTNAQGRFKNQTIAWSGGVEKRPGPFGPAPRLQDGEPVQGEAPALTRNGKASFGAFLLVEEKPSGTVFSRMDKTNGYRGWDLFLSDGRPTVHIIDKYPDTALKVTAKETLSTGVWHHVMAVFDGSIKGSGAVQIYVNGRLSSLEINNNTLGSNIVTDVPFRIGGRSDKDGVSETIKGGKVFLQDLRFYPQVLSQLDIGRLAATGMIREFLAKNSDQRTKEQTNALFDLYLSGFDVTQQKLNDKMARLKKESDAIKERGAITLIMEENKDSKPKANVLVRGSYSNKGEEVQAGTPASLPAMKPESPNNRLGLAQWIVSRSNPLTARVTANRLWAQLFGNGIVETTEDLGVMGARPTHPELLDWLALEFMDSGWDFRSLVRTMVTSTTYRQSAQLTPEKLEKDPLNKLLSRGPRFRPDAEQIRDLALAASGLLVKKVGGPSVKPYQPEGVWEAVAMKDSNTGKYSQDSGEALYRRSLYTYWKRTAPPASMDILNAPSREVFCTRRERSNTPLQAFVTMNDPQFVEAARQLAAHAMSKTGKFDGRLDRITEPLLARKMTMDERAVVQKIFEKAQEHYQKDPQGAAELVSVGESKPDPKLSKAELAAWTLVASQVMNLDECLTK